MARRRLKPWNRRIFLAMQTAACCILASWVAVAVTIILVQEVGSLSGVGSLNNENAPGYKFAGHIRLCLLTVSLVLVVFSGASFVTSNRVVS